VPVTLNPTQAMKGNSSPFEAFWSSFFAIFFCVPLLSIAALPDGFREWAWWSRHAEDATADSRSSNAAGATTISFG
jgi:hypothetical protein